MQKKSVFLYAASELLMLDRTASGIKDFHHEFRNKLQYAAPENLSANLGFSIFITANSLRTRIHVMMAQHFPYPLYTHLEIESLSTGELRILELEIRPMRSVW